MLSYLRTTKGKNLDIEMRYPEPDCSTPLLIKHNVRVTNSKIQKIQAAVISPLGLSVFGSSTIGAAVTVAATNAHLLHNAWYLSGLTISVCLGSFCIWSACQLHFGWCEAKSSDDQVDNI